MENGETIWRFHLLQTSLHRQQRVHHRRVAQRATPVGAGLPVEMPHEQTQRSPFPVVILDELIPSRVQRAERKKQRQQQH